VLYLHERRGGSFRGLAEHCCVTPPNPKAYWKVIKTLYWIGKRLSQKSGTICRRGGSWRAEEGGPERLESNQDLEKLLMSQASGQLTDVKAYDTAAIWSRVVYWMDYPMT
jgi:hypothetical protein